MLYRQILTSVLVLWALLLYPLSTPVAMPVDSPNILWLIGENLGTDLGCYGTAQVETPNLDRLAARGVLYTHAFGTSPVCSPSRSAFMTGMYQTSIGAHNHRSHRDDEYRLPAGVRLLTHRLREAGYYTANVQRIDGRNIGTGKNDFNFHLDDTPFDSDDWEDLKVHQPFYAQVNFRYVERGTTTRPMWRDYDTLPRVADPSLVRIPPYYPDHPVTRRDWATYLNSVSALDRDVGAVLKKLEDDGLAENTIVIFFGDNGRLHVRGLDWCYDSGLRVPLIIWWPEQLAPPEHFQYGTENNQLVSLIDLTATTLSLAGIKKPSNMQGRVILGPDAEPARQFVIGARDRTDNVVQHIRSVRTARYRYIRNFRPERPFLYYHRYKEKVFPVLRLMRELHAQGQLTPVQQVLMAPRLPEEELYDIAHDPYEINNLADSPDPEHQRVLNELAESLVRWIAETGDQGGTSETPEVLEYWEKDAFERHGGPPIRPIEELH